MDALPIIGTVTGVSALVVAVVTAVRDRPKLRVTGIARRRKDGSRWVFVSIRFQIANIGRQPVALTGVGLCQVPTGPPGWIHRLLGRKPKGQHHSVLVEYVDEPDLLPAGAIQTYEISPPPNSFFTDGPGVFAYASDSRKRTTYSRKRWRDGPDPPPQ